MKTLAPFLISFIFLSPVLSQQNLIVGKSNVKHLQFKRNVNSEGVRYKPELEITNLTFQDDNGNGIIDAGENSFISFKVTNKGKGEATDVIVALEPKKETKGLVFENNTNVGTIYPGQSTQVYVTIGSTDELTDGSSVFILKTIEKHGFNPSSEPIAIETRRFYPPEIVVADAVFSTTDGQPAEKNLPIYMKVLVQNIGDGIAENVVSEIVLPNDNCLSLSPKIHNIGTLRKGESKEIKYSFVATQGYASDKVPIKIGLTENHGKYAHSRELAIEFGDELLSTHYANDVQETSEVVVASLTPEVDKNIPETDIINPNRIALIIGNEDYQSKQSIQNQSEINVQFARNDAKMFREYAKKTLGIDNKNIFFLLDATSAEMLENIELVSKLASVMGNNTEIIFYYAGHGLPDEATRVPYLIPVDVSGSNISSAIPVKKLYSELSSSGAKRITVFLDACFSGGGRNSGLIASRGIRVRPKNELLTGNIVVFSASSEQQSALPYEEKQHGMFTYYLLKSLQDTEGKISYGELSEYIQRNVTIESLRTNRKEQIPEVNFAETISGDWENWNFE